MIKIDVNLKYLTDNYNIGSQQLKAYRGKSIKEIMELEAKNGNTKAASFLLNLLSNPKELVNIFRLMNPENRYEIIKNMNFTDKMKLISMLEPEEMLMGLKFFQKDKLIDLLKDTKKEKLFAVAMQKYDLKDFLNTIPEKEQNKFFENKNVEPAHILKGVKNLEKDQLARMVENVTGESQQEKSKEELMTMLSEMKVDTLKNSVKSLEKEEKAFVMENMIKEDPKLLGELDKEAFMAPLELLEKDELLEAMDILEPDDMLPMMSELPEDLMAVTATQLAPEKLAEMLTNEFSSILEQITMNI
ncbi:hypothetical protein IJS77_04115 [bacterium]|nr:hypothetical protein [bacterium]